MKRLRSVLLATALFGLAGCGQKSTIGFRLPDGNAEKGKAAFVALKCISCHSVDGVEFAAKIAVEPAQVTIGGQVAHVKTYGELLTAIVNPLHRVSQEMRKGGHEKISVMPEFNQEMTVEQMIDLVAFLQPHYQKLTPLYSDIPLN